MSIVHVNGVRLWTAVTGDGPPLILCHGGPGAPDYLRSLAEALPARTHRFEQRGCGRSEDAEPNGIDALVADVEALRDLWGIEKCVVAGHSWGAALALLYALRHPGRVERLLYLNGLGIELGWEEEHAAETRRRLSPEERARCDELRRARAAAAGGAEDERLANEALRIAVRADTRDAALTRDLLAAPFRPRINRRLKAEWAERTRDPGLAERVRGCRVPALVLQGARDCRPNWPAERLAALLPRARLVVLAGAGHFPWIDRPDRFRMEVAAFLAAAP